MTNVRHRYRSLCESNHMTDLEFIESLQDSLPHQHGVYLISSQWSAPSIQFEGC